jgi:hypothetical protein
VPDSSKTIIDNTNVCNDVDNCDEIAEEKPKRKTKKTTLDDSNSNSDNESFKSVESGTNSDEEKSNFAPKSGDVYKSIDEEDVYGPTFSQRSTHWVCTIIVLNYKTFNILHFVKCYSLFPLQIG